MLITVALVSSATAAALSLQEFSVDIPDDWNHGIDELRFANSPGFGATITISRPGDSGELTIVSYQSPVIADESVLRNFTNVDSSVQLDLEEWGDFAGYRYSYRENDAYFLQWWLSNRTTILILVYESETAVTPGEIQIIESMVASIRVVSRQ
ncbi:MAG TPA: hypothetical protein EYQ30_09840 [Gammaproteobacteria bacterium]|nr:hypothetical protein [Gammaproteobacteria bacterium]